METAFAFGVAFVLILGLLARIVAIEGRLRQLEWKKADKKEEASDE